MSKINLPAPRTDLPSDLQMREIIDILLRYRKELNYALTNLDSSNFDMVEVGSAISAGVSSLNGLMGELLIQAGEGIRVVTSDQALIISQLTVSEPTYTHDQQVASSTWTIVHDLGKYPDVTVVDSSGHVVVGDVTYLSEHIIEISFGAPFTGKAYLNYGQASESGATTYIHDQTVASDTWTIVHDLDRFPSVTIVDSANTEVQGDVTYTHSNQVVVTFSSAFSGKAYLN